MQGHPARKLNLNLNWNATWYHISLPDHFITACFHSIVNVCAVFWCLINLWTHSYFFFFIYLFKMDCPDYISLSPQYHKHIQWILKFQIAAACNSDCSLPTVRDVTTQILNRKNWASNFRSSESKGGICNSLSIFFLYTSKRTQLAYW